METKQEPEVQPVEEQAAPQEEEQVAEEETVQEETAQEEAPAVEETLEEAEAAVTEEAEEEAAATDSTEDTSAETAEEDTQEADEPAEAEQKEAPVAKSKRVHPDPKKPSKPRKAKKVDLRSTMLRENFPEDKSFKESKFDDEELHRMQQAERGEESKEIRKHLFGKGFCRVNERASLDQIMGCFFIYRIRVSNLNFVLTTLMPQDIDSKNISVMKMDSLIYRKLVGR